MGEIAEMMINGLMCSGCGVFMDDMDEPGYSRQCRGCARPPPNAKKLDLSALPPFLTPEQIAARDRRRAEKKRAKRQRRKARKARQRAMKVEAAPNA